MRLIVYISEFTGDKAKASEVLSSITETAKENNQKDDITGVLFYQNGKFIQIIEGEDEPLASIMKRIEADSRHTNLTYLVNEEVQSHGFEDWNMDAFNLSDSENIDTDELQKIYDAYRKITTLSGDTLALTYKALVEEGVFAEHLKAEQ